MNAGFFENAQNIYVVQHCVYTKPTFSLKLHGLKPNFFKNAPQGGFSFLISFGNADVTTLNLIPTLQPATATNDLHSSN